MTDISQPENTLRPVGPITSVEAQLQGVGQAEWYWQIVDEVCRGSQAEADKLVVEALAAVVRKGVGTCLVA